MSMNRVRVCALPGCDVAIVRKWGETRQNFKKRRYCCRECAAKDSNRRRGKQIANLQSGLQGLKDKIATEI